MLRSPRCLATRMNKNVVSTCSSLNTESRIMSCTACFCLLGQKKGSKHAVHTTYCGLPLILHKAFKSPLSPRTEEQQQAEMQFFSIQIMYERQRESKRGTDHKKHFFFCKENSTSIYSILSTSSCHYTSAFSPISE